MMMVMKLLCFLSSLFLQILLAAAAQSKCNHEAEISALLQFKDGFQINCTDPYGYPYFSYPKTSSWNIESLNNNNNASLEWNGVECDPVTGHVIGLDLSSSCLHGSIINSSSIFSHLVHLQHLNLAFNDFDFSSIPSELGNLWRLTYLNLSSSNFAGQVPLEISKLSMLSSLDSPTPIRQSSRRNSPDAASDAASDSGQDSPTPIRRSSRRNSPDAAFDAFSDASFFSDASAVATAAAGSLTVAHGCGCPSSISFGRFAAPFVAIVLPFGVADYLETLLPGMFAPTTVATLQP